MSGQIHAILAMAASRTWVIGLILIQPFIDVKPPWPGIGNGRHISAFAGSPECIDLAGSWISTCLKSHPQCRETASDILPDRVIQVGPGLSLRLVENFSAKLGGVYAALSHCWGGHVAMQLKTGNLADFKEKIGFEDLPKTFQDAVTVCDALGIGYIWIDSLCIIQDSEEDWSIQGSKMAQIYSNCLITIAADAAPNSRAGFLKRDPAMVRSSAVRIKRQTDTPSDQSPEVHIRRDRELTYTGGFPHHYFYHPDTSDDTEDDELQSHLSNRGWCFQEAILPSRMLHFAKDELCWTCTTDAFCECKDGSIVPKKRAFSEASRVIDRARLKEDWANIIGEYTRRRLTFWSDRLAALAGIAARVNSMYSDINYLAGLWSDELPVALLWMCTAQSRPSERIRPYIAPSWSWASITGHVHMSPSSNYITHDQSRLEIVAADCSAAGLNKYGAVKAAQLSVKGILFRVRLLDVYDDGSGFGLVRVLGGDEESDTNDLEGYGYFDVPDDLCVYGNGESSSGEGRSDEEGSDEDESVPEVPGEFTMLNVLGYEWFLILRKVDGKETQADSFERVAIFNGSNYSRAEECSFSAMSPAAQALGMSQQILLV